MTQIDRDVALEVARYLDSWLSFRQRYLRVPGMQAAFLLRRRGAAVGRVRAGRRRGR